MPLGERLRRLDDRVVGRGGAPTARDARNGYVVGLLGVLAVGAVVVGSGETYLAGGVGGFLGLVITSGVRWWRADPSRRQVVLAGWLLVAAALTGAALSHDRWVDEDVPGTGPPFPAGVTFVVQCDATASGRAYSHQQPVTERPECDNGATPRVVLLPY